VIAPVAPTGSPIVRVVLRVAIVAAVVVALIAVATSSRYGLRWRLITFTYQANLLAAAFYLWALLSPRADARVALRGAVVLYLVVAGVIWNVFLTGRSMGYTPANLLLHIVVPVLALTDWFVVRGKVRLRWWLPIVWLVYPAAYAALALMVLNNAGRRAPYYFLDPGSIGAAGVAVNMGVLGAGVLALGYTLMAVTHLNWPADRTR